MADKKIIGVAQILGHLKDGMTREDIAQHYGITMAECKQIFMHPDLKGKKTIKKKEASYVLVDDADKADDTVIEEVEVVDEEVVENTTEDTTGDTPEQEEVQEPAMEQEAVEEAEEAAQSVWGESRIEDQKEAPKATWDD